MARDSKLPSIEIKRHNFNTEAQDEIAQRLEKTWEEEGPTPFTDLEAKYEDYSDSQYAKVMDRYMGPPDHDVTVEEIRARYGSITEYLNARKRDDVDTDTRELTERELNLYKEGYREGLKDGLNESQD